MKLHPRGFSARAKPSACGGNTKSQAPTSNEASIPKVQGPCRGSVELCDWSFSGAWMLVVGGCFTTVAQMFLRSLEARFAPAHRLALFRIFQSVRETVRS